VHGATKTLYWANTAHSGVLVGTLICGVHDGLRLLFDSGTTYHVYPKDFGPVFALNDSQDTLDELPVLHATNGKRLYIYGSKNVSLVLRNGVTMHISYIVCDTKIPIISVNRLREGGFNTYLTQI
jgi:hypothetical protein